MKPDNTSEAQRLVRQAVAATKAGDHERAVELLNLALSLNGDKSRASLRPSREVEVSDHQPFRLRWMMEAAAAPAHISDAELLVCEGIEASEAGDHARALDLLSISVVLDEGHIQGWMWLGNETEDPEDKAFCLQQVLALDPGNEPALQRLASLKEQARQEEQPEPGEQADQHEQADAVRALRQALGVLEDPEAAVEAEETVLPGPHLDRGIARALVAGAFVAGSGNTAQPVGARPAEDFREAPTGWIWAIILSEFPLIAILGVVLLAFIARGVSGLPAPLPLLRLLLGLAFVLFVPGYAIQAALFPRRDALDVPERLALSFGLSVAVVPPLALILDWLPWGLRLWPIVAAEGLAIALPSAVALIRRARLPLEESPLLSLNLDLRGWWATQDRAGRLLYSVLACALLLALISAAAIVITPKPGDRFTEFYLLGPDGLAESYPRETAPGQELSVTAGIANHEGQAAEYRIEVHVGGELIGMAGPVTLEEGEAWEAPVTYTLAQPGDDQQTEFLLYRDGGQEPYRSLRLWINVVEAPGDGDG